MLLRVACSPADWVRLAPALDAANLPLLADYVRAGLVFAPRLTAAAPVALTFAPMQVADLQRIGAAIGLRLDAAPVVAPVAEPEWVATEAERAAAVAAADAIVRAHRHRNHPVS